MNILEIMNLPMFDENAKLPDPDLLLLYKELQDREIWLDDDVSWGICSFIIKYIQYLERRSTDHTTPIKLHIFSSGGSLDAMWALIDTIQKSKIPVDTINEGVCYSAAFSIFLCGRNRTMGDNGLFIAHEGSAQMGGSFKETKQAMAQYEKEINKSVAHIASKTRLTENFIREKFDQNSDWYIDKEAAIQYGIINDGFVEKQFCEEGE